MIYHAVFDQAEDGSIWGYTPDVPGAYGAGDTLDEAKASLREGIRLWFEVARERGEVPASDDDAIELVATSAAV